MFVIGIAANDSGIDGADVWTVDVGIAVVAE